MAILKYGTGITPITKEHCGCTFQSTRAANIMMKGQSNDRKRNTNQINKKLFLMNATNHWRTLPAVTKTAWSNFATTYPQPTKRNPLKFLSGYQNFIKRASYLFLNYGIEEIYTTPPSMEELTVEPVSFSIQQTDNCIDCTEAYIRNFGTLPKAGDFLLMKVLPMAVSSGQYFAPITETIECLAVYIDGLFLSLSFPESREQIVYSIFLSKPVNQSVSYTGTKCRYMGCFTAKKFIELSDTPKTYVGQAGKVATVKPDETGLEFSTPSAGGLTCADLINCPTIISMLATDQTILQALTLAGLSSNPIVNMGSYYNWWAVTDARFIAPAGWHVPTKTELDALISYLINPIGGKVKEVGLINWNTPNTGAINTAKLNWRGTGQRLTNGTYSDLKNSGPVWSNTYYSTPGGTDAYCYAANYNSTAFSSSVLNKKIGNGLRLFKDSTVLTNGQSGTMTGNDGKIYRTICVGTVEIMADNSNETLFRNGVAIPLISDASAWSALITAGRSYPLGNPLYS